MVTKIKAKPEKLEESIWYVPSTGKEHPIFESERDAPHPDGWGWPLDAEAKWAKGGTELFIPSTLKSMGAKDITNRVSDHKHHELKWETEAGMKEKLEYIEWAKKIEKERGIPIYEPQLHWHGIPLGQRRYETVTITGGLLNRPPRYFEGLTYEQLNYLNNAACQQMWDDIQRTCINGLDLAHRTIEKRFGKEVTPETINEYMENHNHNLASGSLLMEHMTETHPKLVEDAYVKAFTGNDELADELDPRFKIDINELFPEWQAKQIKKELGKKLFQAAHIPTAYIHLSDGGLPRAWVGQQSSLAFLATYRIPAGEAITSDFVYNIKHGDVVFIGTRMPWRRAKMVNSPGGINFGYMSDIIQDSRAPEMLDPFNPPAFFLENAWWGMNIYDIAYLHTYLAGGSTGWTQILTVSSINEIDEDIAYSTLDQVTHLFMPPEFAPASLPAVHICAEYTYKYATEVWDDFPVVTELFWGAAMRTLSSAAISGAAAAYFTRNPLLGLTGVYHSLMLQKHDKGRLGWYAADGPHHRHAYHGFNTKGEFGGLLELRGPNYPDYNWSVATNPLGNAYVGGVHFLCGHAYATNPVIKVCFADPSLKVDYRYPRREWARGAVKEFMPAGERDVVIPAK